MAIYSLEKRGGRYSVRFRDGNGKRTRRRLDATTLRQAEKDAAEIAHAADRARQGLEKALSRMTLDQLHKKYAPIGKQLRSWKHIEQRHRDYIRAKLGDKLIHQVEPADIELVMAEAMEAGLAPRTAEHLRVQLSALFTFAIKKLRVLRGDNPAQLAEPPRIPEHVPRFIDKQSVLRMLEKVPEHSKGAGIPYRAIVAVAVYTGMRKGEVLGLQPQDIDLERNIIWVARSYDLPTTKDGKVAPAGFSDELKPYLQKALLGARGTWLFSRRDGSMLGPDVKVEKVVRKALRDAGIVAGFEVVCVTKGKRRACGFKEQRMDGQVGPCPDCGRTLHVRAIPPDFDFKDLRSTWVTLFIEETGDIDAAVRQVRHSGHQLIHKRYRFARDRHLADQVKRLSFQDAPALPAKLGHRLDPNTVELNRREASPANPD